MYDYVNDDLKNDGDYSEDEVDGVKYFAVLQSENEEERMPDLVRVTFKGGRVVGVQEWEIMTRQSPNPRNAVTRMQEKAGQKPGTSRQTTNVLLSLRKLKDPDAAARAISDWADTDHVDLDSVRMVSDTPGKELDYTKTLGTKPGRLTDTHTSADIEEPVCPSAVSDDVPDVDAPNPPVRWNGDIPETDPEPIIDDPIIDFPL